MMMAREAMKIEQSIEIDLRFDSCRSSGKIVFRYTFKQNFTPIEDSMRSGMAAFFVS